MNIEPETLKKLVNYLDGPSGTEWGHDIEKFAPDYGKLRPKHVPKLADEKLRRLWSAQWFARVHYEFPRPNASQWKGLRSMTALLVDRTKPLGDRFCAARELCRGFFKPVQSPVLLRALLIVEGGLFGSIATMNHTNRLLKDVGNPEFNYDDADSITLALKHVKELIEKWAPEVGATTLGERARIPWHLCQVIDPNVGMEGRKPGDLEDSGLSADIEEIFSNEPVGSTTAQVQLKVRLGQWKFGAKVRQIWKHHCSVTGSCTTEVLEASHIKSWANSTDKERLDAKNGLLLNATLHKLFDAHLITFGDSGKMLVSSKLSKVERGILGVIGKELSQKPSAETVKYLLHHRARFLR